MAILPNLRVVNTQEEILLILSKIQMNQSHVVIWQKENEQNRKLNTATLSLINKSIGFFHLRSISGDWNPGVNGDIALYFKGDEESILFKVKNLIVKKGELIVPIPNEVRLLEKRNRERLQLKQKESRNTLIIQKVFENDNRRQFCVPVIDISITGVAVALNKSETKYFYEGDAIYITKLAGTRLTNYISGKVVYLKPVEYYDSHFKLKNFRVGIQFDTFISKEYLNFFNFQKSENLDPHI